jgi:cytoskeleton protein RodZ
MVTNDEKTIGDILKAEREKKNITYAQISDELKISTTFIQALEQNKYDIFPGEPYVVGFLNNYSEFLGLNPNSIVEKYKNQKYINMETPFEILANPTETFYFNKGKMTWIIVILSLLAILSIALILKLT